MESIGFMPIYTEIFGLQISQTLFASIFGTAVFLILTLIYKLLKNNNPHNKFTNLIDLGLEGMMSFFKEIGGDKIPYSVIKRVLFIFVYVFICNIVGLIGDLFVLVYEDIHYYFRPVSTDIFFNLMLAFFCVGGSVSFGFKKHGFHYIEKYLSYKGLGIVPKVTGILTFIGKIFDIIIGLFIGIIEILGEFSRVLSLSLRLFGNILAGMVLLGLIVTATMSFLKVPFGLPLIVVAFELIVGFLQAFVFSILTLVYFKVASESHH